MNEERLIDLETKVTFQEHQIEELRQTVHEQYLAIARLEKTVKTLTEQVVTGEGNDPAHVKPPHY